MAERLAVGSLPDYLIVAYDVLRATVVLPEFIDGESIDASRVHARTALGPTARRAGWIGASIDLAGLERRVMVGPSLEPEQHAWEDCARNRRFGSLGVVARKSSSIPVQNIRSC